MLVSLTSDDMSPVQLCCLSVCNTGVREPQEVRSLGGTKGLLILLGIGIVTCICELSVPP
jgi:hypothetical protein